MKAVKERKIAIVTGGGSGLGFAIAQCFVKNDIFTILIGRNEQKLKTACEQLGELATYVAFDVRLLDKIPELIHDISARYGKIDILVNNAGINSKKPFIEVTDEDFNEIILTNLVSVFSLTREVSKIMLAEKSGSIINISSMASQYGIPKVIAYTAAKSGIEGMTRALAVELSPSGIRVNCIAPGFIATDMSAKALDNDPERKNKVLSRTPMGALGMPSDIGAAAYFLASDQSKYITGIVMPVDGGNSIGF
ncbi:SDR family NAD(P)-dependent oxidoreductase [Pedobacter frigoris]|uniref:SDR family oxidoreductase n=1 Tax=Pedobacter frigoris TaxID=2571272 RepID=A0A4U1CHX9_9SPHI|nr:SDR family oxidoreductase [Pedobacter frigoris]TKC06973.1 SDR family oxidoreductase [Pedobacter frigoris]